MAEVDAEQIRLLHFIGDLYDAAAEPLLWRCVAAKLASLFQSESCMLLMAYAQGGAKFLGVTPNIHGEVWEDYENYYYAQDQWIAECLRRPGQASLGHELAPEDWYRKSEFLNDLCLSAGIHSLVGAALPIDRDRFAVVAVHRPKHVPRFDQQDVRRLDMLIPHLRRAIQLTIRLSEAGLDHQAALDGLERAHSATIVVDRNGAILFATQLADTILRCGKSLRRMNGRLIGVTPQTTARLTLLIREAADSVASTASSTHCGGIAIERDEGRLPLTVLVAPFRPKRTGFGAPVPAALVFIRDPEAFGLATDILKDLFGLTRAQAALAARIAQGENLEQIAANLRITLHTARDHLKVIFGKTGTSRQSQLVALLTRTVADLGDIEEAVATRIANAS